MKSFFFFLFSLLLLFQGSTQFLFSIQQNLTQSLTYYFGYPLIVKGNNLFIGSQYYAFLYSINGGNYSSPYVFSGPTNGDYGESSLDIEGNMCVIADSWNQMVYSYSFNGSAWNQQQTITGNDTISGDYFGYSISLNSNGKLLAVGAPDKNSNNGTLYIFNYNGSVWNQQAEIQSPVPGGSYFGYTILFVNNAIVASAPFFDSSGYVGVFVPSGNSWTLQQTLLSNVSPGAAFGFTLAFDGNTLAVGAHYDTVGGLSLGSVFLYTNNGTWNLLTKIYPTSNYSGSSNPNVGDSISIYGNTLVVGSIKLELVFVFTFSGSTWSQTQVIPGPSHGSFGIGVFLNADTLYAPAVYYNSGIVYIFTRPQVTTGQVTTGQVTTGQVTTGQVTTGQVATSLQVTTGFQTSSLQISGFQTGSVQTSESPNVSSGNVIAIMDSIIISFLIFFLILLF